MTGVIEYLHRSPIREAHLPGTSAWTPHLVAAAVACALYGVARWRHGRRFGRGSGRLLLLAPLGKSAASRLMATTRQVSWRSAAALPPLALIGYSFWRVGEQVIGGLDPNFTANAWGGPSYLGAMACHYLDAALMIAVGAWLLDKILPSAVAAEGSAAPRSAPGSGRSATDRGRKVLPVAGGAGATGRTDDRYLCIVPAVCSHRRSVWISRPDANHPACPTPHRFLDIPQVTFESCVPISGCGVFSREMS